MAILGATESDPVAIRELWDNDAKYFYYDHGPLARVELGDNQVQGVDYAYTLQGWLKGINSNSLSAARDMGKDGYNDSANLNANFGQDVASFSLGYFAGDYSAIESTTNFLGATDGSTLQANRNDLWNGNIGMMQTSLIVHDAQGAEMRENLGMAYRYDQLNRLTAARGFTDFDAASNAWGTATSDGIYNNFFSYDANGNILTQQRWSRSTLVDDLTYHYAQNNGHITQNRLYNVNDAAAVTDDISSDMENQDPFVAGTGVNGNNNYIYSKIGELVSDELEEIQSIVWRVDSKIKQVNRTQGSDKMNLKFDYDAMGNRVAKHVLDQENTCIHSTYYVRDASGNVMAVYERDAGCESGAATYALTERHIYGSSRVGMNTAPVELMQESLPIVEDERVRVLGKKQYEIANHLGNVLTVVSDEKRVLDTNSDGLVDTYMATIISVTDYSPFGVTLDGRSWSNDEYRYGFNGKDRESEFSSGAYDFGARIHDARLGRWMSVDPKFALQTGWSTYKYGLNSPIIFIDPDGETEFIFNVTINEKTGRGTITMETSRRLMCTGGVKWVESWYDLGGRHKEQSYKDFITVNVTIIHEDGTTEVRRYQEMIGDIVDTDWYMPGVQDKNKGETKFDFRESPDVPQDVAFGFIFIGDGEVNPIKADRSKNILGSICLSDISALLKREGFVAKGYNPGTESWEQLTKGKAKDWIEKLKETSETSQKVGEVVEMGIQKAKETFGPEKMVQINYYKISISSDGKVIHSYSSATCKLSDIGSDNTYKGDKSTKVTKVTILK